MKYPTCSDGTRSSIARRIRNLGLYLLIALALAVGIIWFAYKSDGTHNQSISKWGGLFVNSAILYGYVVKEGKPFWHAWGFWLAFTSVLCLHLLVFIVIFNRVDHWSVSWFLLMYPVEGPALAIACDWAIHVTGGKPRYGRQWDRRRSSPRMLSGNRTIQLRESKEFPGP